MDSKPELIDIKYMNQLLEEEHTYRADIKSNKDMTLDELIESYESEHKEYSELIDQLKN